MQLEHGPDRDDRSKIGGAVRGTWSYRSYDATRSIVSPWGPRLPSILTALTCTSRAPSVDGFEHPSSLARSLRNARNQTDPLEILTIKGQLRGATCPVNGVRCSSDSY